MKIWQKIMIFSAMLFLMLVPDAYAEDTASVSIERVSGGNSLGENVTYPFYVPFH